MSAIPDSEFGARVRARLRDEQLVWLTATGDDGTPQPNPVWFLLEPGEDSVLVYNDHRARRLQHVAVRPRVALNFHADGGGDDVVVITGVAEQALDAPPPDRNEAYLVKYRAGIDRIGSAPDRFAERYSVPLRIRFTAVRGF